MPRRRRKTLQELRLLVGAQERSPDTLRAALDQGTDPNLLDNQGRTALWRACAAGELGNVALLLTAGAHLNLADPQGKTPLYMAAFGSDYRQDQTGDRMVEHLLAAGADPNLADDMGLTPLMQALDHPQRVRALLAAGADPEATTSIAFKSATVLTHLVTSCRSDQPSIQAQHRESLDAVLDAGADPNRIDGNGRTPLTLALDQIESLPFVAPLLRAGADPDLVSPRRGCSPRALVENASNPIWRVAFERHDLEQVMAPAAQGGPQAVRDRRRL